MEIISSILVIVLFTGFVKLATVLQVLQYGLGLRGLSFSVVMLVFALILSIMSVSSSLSEGDFKSLLYFENTDSNLKAQYAKYKPFIEANSDKEITKALTKTSESQKASGTAGNITSSKYDAALLLSYTITQLQSAFKLAFIILLPLLAIDLLVVHAFQLLDVKNYEPVLLALPLKLLLLYSINGVSLITDKLLNGFM